MKLRRPLIYVLLIVVMILVYSQYGPGKESNRVTIVMPPDPITLEQIFNDFTDLKDNELPVKPELGGTFYTSALRISPGFKGVDGDRFYAAIEDGHVAYVLEYSLKEQYDRKLLYQVSRVIEGTTWPSMEGDLYVRTDQGFKAQK